MIGRTIISTVLLVLLETWVYAADCNNGGRYEDMGDGTVQDCRTGLIWLKDANCTDNLGLTINRTDLGLNFNDAMKWVKALHNGHCGLSDESYAGEWRLPTITEWRAMIASAIKQGFTVPILTNAAGNAKWTDGNIFFNVQSPNYYWSSTVDLSQPGVAWNLTLSYGYVANDNMTFEDYVWPVRGGQSGEFGSVLIQ